mgnify:CR=1 FL=1
MAHYWRIERQNYHLETKYLAKVRPTRWVWDLEDAMEFSDDTVIDACKWLVLMGVSFTVRQFTRV